MIYTDSLALQSMVNEAIKLSDKSSFDVVSIIIVIFFMVITSSLITYIIIGLGKKLDAYSDFISVGYNNLITDVDTKLSSLSLNCKEHLKTSKKYLDDGITNMKEEQARIYNNLISLISDQKGECFYDTSLALDIFDRFMKAHCLDKAIALAEELANASTTATIDGITAKLGIKFRKITEEEASILSKIQYTNSHYLSEVIEPILKEENWKNFVNTYVRALVETNWNNKSALSIKDSVISSFDSLIENMRLTIKRNGGLL